MRGAKGKVGFPSAEICKEMTSGGYAEHLRNQLNGIDEAIDRARQAVETSSPPRRAEALAELVRLKMRHDDLARRLDAADREGAEAWSALHASFREEADALRDTLERWLTKHG
jgi:chromosome segregation ATPase